MASTVTPTRGTEITASLPAREAAPLQPQAGPCATSARVLVVDDLLASAETLKVLVESEGYVVEIACDGPSALEKAASFRPDVVILDIGLPGMSGFEVAQRMRQLPQTRDALLIALTGYGEAESRLRSEKAGFDHHVVKPANIDLLFDILSGAGRRGLQIAS